MPNGPADCGLERARPASGAEPGKSGCRRPLTTGEVRRLFSQHVSITRPYDYHERWSRWRRRHQARAQCCHHQRRLMNRRLLPQSQPWPTRDRLDRDWRIAAGQCRDHRTRASPLTPLARRVPAVWRRVAGHPSNDAGPARRRPGWVSADSPTPRRGRSWRVPDSMSAVAYDRFCSVLIDQG